MSGKIKGQSEKKGHLIYLSTGSNMGNRQENLESAQKNLSSQLGELIKLSSIYETEAWGKKDQSAFLNQVILFKTEYSPENVLEIIQVIEESMGRKRLEKWGPRIIDIDILFYNELIINEINLIVPHPEIQNRRFILMPLLEISPNFSHPVLKTSIKDLSTKCIDTSKVEPYIS